MRSDEQFPAGFGFDPGMAHGFARSAGPQITTTDTMAGIRDEANPYSGQLAARFEFPVPANYGSASTVVHLGRSGFHLDSPIEAAQPEQEPQSVVITTALVGILLATAGYFVEFI